MSAITLEQLQVIINAQTAPLQKEMDKVKRQVESATGSVTRNMDKINKKTSFMGSQLAKVFSTAAITYGIVRFTNSAIKLASNLEEVQNVVDVSFGEMSYKVESFAKTALKSFGLSELSAKRTASSFMAMSVGMGINRDKASNMAIEMTGLSADMASFYNISNDMAQTALSSIWTGETETLKKYGILITEVNLQQYAYRQGIDKNINKMTQAEKTTLRYLYVQDALRLAQGDFARTSGSWANQVRILSETFKELSTIIGQGFIKALTPVIQVINAVLSKIVQFAKAVQTVLGRLFGTSGVASSKPVDNASNSLGGYNDTLKDTEKQAKKTANSLSFLDELNVIKSPTSGGADNGAGTGGDGFNIDFSNMDFTEPDTSGIDAWADKLMKYFEPLKDISFDNLSDSFGKVWAGIQNVAAPILDFFDFFYFEILVPLGKWTIEEALPRFFDVLASSLKVVGSILSIVEPLLEDLWKVFLKPIANFAGDVLLVFLQGLTWLLEDVSSWISDNKELVEDIIVVIGSFAAAWGIVNIAIGIWNGLATFGAAITGALAGAIAFLTSPIGLVVAAIGAVIAIVALLVRHWDEVCTVAQEVWKTIVDSVTNAAKFVGDRLSEMWNNIVSGAKVCWDGIVNIFKGVASWVDKTIIQPVSNGFKSFVNGLIGGVEGFVNGAINGINGLIRALNNLIKFDLPDWLGGGSFSLNLREVQTVSFPRLYNGGIAYGDTLARVGDYASSSVNPEVIAPLSKLQQYMGGGSSEEQTALLRDVKSLLQAILQKPAIEEDSIGRISKKFIDSENERTGGYVFG